MHAADLLLSGALCRERSRARRRLRHANSAHPRYATDAAWAEISGLEGVPVWQVLARPCIGHVRMHLGEMAALCQATRAAGHGEGEARTAGRRAQGFASPLTS